jgi:hypothetical protein
MRDTETYLTEAEVKRLSGKTYAKVQARVLAARGWHFELDAGGKVLILRAYHDERLGKLGEPAARPRLEYLRNKKRAMRA